MSDRRVSRKVTGKVESSAFGARDRNAAENCHVLGVNAFIAHLDAGWRAAAPPDHFDGCVRSDPERSMHSGCGAACNDAVAP